MNQILKFLIDRLENEYGAEEVNKIVEGYSKKRISSFRINSLKTNIKEVENELQNNGVKDFESINFEGEVDGIIIDSKLENTIRDMDIYKNGNIYFQSLSSMLPPIFLEIEEGYDILDMAAAPGGKTTEMAAISSNKANITAVEFNKNRYEKLKYNIELQGAKCTTLLKDGRRLDDFLKFDSILLDAPCSGSGTLNIENIDDNFSENLVKKCISIQEQMLRKACKLIKRGKSIIYSTCSILKEENEEIVNKVLNENKNLEIEKIDVSRLKNIELLPSNIDGTITVMPNEYYEGFYIAKIRKN